jgi:hypothetical protein
MSTGLKAGIAGLTGLAGLGGAGMGLRRYVQGKQREAARLRRNKLLAAGAGLAGLTAAGGAYMANKNK